MLAMIPISVENLNDKTITFYMDLNDTIADLKQKIQDEAGIRWPVLACPTGSAETILSDYLRIGDFIFTSLWWPENENMPRILKCLPLKQPHGPSRSRSRCRRYL